MKEYDRKKHATEALIMILIANITIMIENRCKRYKFGDLMNILLIIRLKNQHAISA